MDYYERAKSAYNRRDVVRAAVILAEGLIRDPANDEGVGWLLRVYVEDLRGPGLERELLRVMEKQRNGHDLYRVVCAELRELEKFEKLEALQKVRRQLGLFTDVADNEPIAANEPAPTSAATTDERDDDTDDDDDAEGDDDDDDEHDESEDSDVRRMPVPPSSERWDRFKSPLNAGDEDDGPRTTTLRQRSRPLRAVADDEESLYARGRSSREKDAQRKRAFVIGGVLIIALVAVVLFALLSPPRGETPPLPFGNSTPTPGLSNPGSPDGPPAVVPDGTTGAVPSTTAPEASPAQPELPPPTVLSPPGDGAPVDGSAPGSGTP